MMVEPERQLRHDGLGVRYGVHRDVIALEGFDEGVGHAVRLRAAHRRRAWLHADLTEQGCGVPGDEAGAVAPMEGVSFCN